MADWGDPGQAPNEAGMTEPHEIRRGYEQFVPRRRRPGCTSIPRLSFPASGSAARAPRTGGPRLVPGASAVQRYPRDRLCRLEPACVGPRPDTCTADTQPAVLAAGISPGGRAQEDGAAPDHRLLPERPAPIRILYLADKQESAVSGRLLRRHGPPPRPGRSSAVILRRFGPLNGDAIAAALAVVYLVVASAWSQSGV